MAYVTATCRLRKTSPMSVVLRARRKCSDLMLRHARTTRYDSSMGRKYIYMC